MGAYASEVVRLAQSWVGLKESDGSYKKIIDIYNKYTGKRPRNVKMQYGWAWCACTWSALAIKLGYTNVMPIEISCQELIKAAIKMGIWVENDNYIPNPGDGVLYDWDDSGKGDCTGWADHIGVVETVNKNSGYFVVIEGNYKDAVKRRTVSINGRFIRGFITPKYDEEKETVPKFDDTNKKINEIVHEVIAGKWGSGDIRKNGLEKAGYDYKEVQTMVNFILNCHVCDVNHSEQEQPIAKRVTATCKAKYEDVSTCGTYETTANLYCRNDAGTNKKAICKIPKGTSVQCYGYYSIDTSKQKWLYIRVILDGIQYIGFSHSKYLKKR